MKLAAIILFVLVVLMKIVLAPIALIWAVSGLFGITIEYTLANYLYALLLVLLFSK